MEGTSHRRVPSNPHLPSAPTTPLRPSSRTSLRSSAAYDPFSGDPSDPYSGGGAGGPGSLSALEPAFAELADGMADLEANFMHIQLLHESLARFSENFAAFLYGLNVNAFCVDFPEAPTADSFKRAKVLDELDAENRDEDGDVADDLDPDATIVSTATSFVDHPLTGAGRSRFTAARVGRARGTTRGPTTSRGSSRAGAAAGAGSGRGASAGAGRTRASGIARGTARGRAGVR